MNAVLTVNPDGTLCGLYTELIPLQEIGALTVSRVSEIEFNDSTQLWEVRDRDGTLIFSDPSRQQCLNWEHEEFNH